MSSNGIDNVIFCKLDIRIRIVERKAEQLYPNIKEEMTDTFILQQNNCCSNVGKAVKQWIWDA